MIFALKKRFTPLLYTVSTKYKSYQLKIELGVGKFESAICIDRADIYLDVELMLSCQHGVRILPSPINDTEKRKQSLIF